MLEKSSICRLVGVRREQMMDALSASGLIYIG
jgi:hypothetical protein